MNFAILTTSTGDTQLACATVKKMIEQAHEEKQACQFTLLPLDTVAKTVIQKELHDLLVDKNENILFSEKEGDEFSAKKSEEEKIEYVKFWIEKNKIDHVVLGFPSPLNDKFAFELAMQLPDTCQMTLLYEYMFKEKEHIYFKNHYGEKLAKKLNLQIAVPLDAAKKDFQEFAAEHVVTVGHLSIDQAVSTCVTDKSLAQNKKTRELLKVSEETDLVFVSGTSRSDDVDIEFLKVLLDEMQKGQVIGKYQDMQLRFGLHPGVKNPAAYLQKLITVVENYLKDAKEDSSLVSPCQIILTENFKKKLSDDERALFESETYAKILLHADVSGADAAHAANRVAQAVPGALLNEAGLSGKPALIGSGDSYLPKECITSNPNTFFAQLTRDPLGKKELGLDPQCTAPENVARALFGK